MLKKRLNGRGRNFIKQLLITTKEMWEQGSKIEA